MDRYRGLSRLLGPGVLTRGIDYYMRRRAVVDPGRRPGEALGTVTGSGGERYRTEVLFTAAPDGTVAQFSSTCSCPYHLDCKHGVALLLTALDGQPPDRSTPRTSSRIPGASTTAGSRSPSRPGTPPAAQVPEQSPPAWERVLTELAGAPGERSDQGDPLALLVEWSAPSPASPPGPANTGGIRLRPVRRGDRGWVRNGANWTDLSYPSWNHRVREDHRTAVHNVWRSGGDLWRAGVWLDLGGVGSAAVWHALRGATSGGVALLPTVKDVASVHLCVEPAELRIEVSSAGDDLRVAPSILVDSSPADPAGAVLLGDPVHGIAVRTAGTDGHRVLLARLDRPMDRATVQMFRRAGLVIPAADRPRFLGTFLPALRRRHRIHDADGNLPVQFPPRLALLVQPLAGHRLGLGWQWLYRVGEDEQRIPVAREPGSASDGDESAGPLRDHRAEAALLAEINGLLGDLAVLGPNTAHPGGDPEPLVVGGDATIRVATELLPLLRGHSSVSIDMLDELPDYRPAVAEPVIEVRSSPSTDRDWFDLSVRVLLDEVEVPFALLFVALANRQASMILPDGQYFSLDTAQWDGLRRLIEEARQLQDRDGQLKISRYQLDWWTELERLGVVTTQSKEWLARVQRWRDGVSTPAGAPPMLTAQLRPYQLDGFRWLNTLWVNEFGGILADDMGLGKTVQMLAAIAAARERDPHGPPVLVVAPTSVVGNWQRETARFVPSLPTVVITETAGRRGSALAAVIDGAELVVTSYTLFRLEFDAYDELDFSALVLDEAQTVKNHQSKVFNCAKRLAAPVKFAMTGTPMENNVMELWALFAVTAPGLFPYPARFTEQYRVPIERDQDQEVLSRLRRRIGPLLLRRTKDDVGADLPAKQEQVLLLDLEPAHRRAYQRHLQRERQKVLGLLDELQDNRFAILRSLTLLRQASIDPGLVDTGGGEQAGSTKLTVLLDLLTEAAAEGHRVLVFSQFTRFLARVRDRLDDAGPAYAYLDGRTRRRQGVIDEFRAGTAPVFLISLKAGGVGLNLTEADYCIITDPWWNPAVEAQAVDRAHRIGQTRPVLVYRLVSKGTIEEKVMALKESKAAMVDAVLTGTGAGAGALTAADVRELLSDDRRPPGNRPPGAGRTRSSSR